MRDTFIYALVDPRDGAVRYIGKTRRGFLRPESHFRPSGLAESNPAKRAWLADLRGQGLRPRIEVVAECMPRDLDTAEIFCIAYYRYFGAALLNATDGGPGATGLKVSAETRAKQSAAKKGQQRSAQWRINMAAAQRGRKHPPHVRAKIGLKHRGKIVSPETRAKQSAAKPRRAVIDAAGKRFESTRAAGAAYGIDPSGIWQVCTGRRKHACGFVFRFEDGISGSLRPRKSVSKIPVRVNLISRMK